MLLGINSVVRRHRRRLRVLAAVLVLCGVVVFAHSAMGGDHMDDGAVMCVAVLAVGAVAAIAAVAGASRSHLTLRWSAVRLLRRQPLLVANPPQPRARAGPSALQVFRL